MKKIRLSRLSSQLLSSNTQFSRTPRIRTSVSRLQPCGTPYIRFQRQYKSTVASPDDVDPEKKPESEVETEQSPPNPRHLPSPEPSRALYSAKLAALHARLSLSSKLPVQTLARALIDPSADANPLFNNVNLAFVGSTMLNYHTSEYLIAKFPRLPMAILFAAMKGYAGDVALHQIARAWGVEAAAAAGFEVDPGYLQFDANKPTMTHTRFGYVRAESAEIRRYRWRRGMSSRVTYDDAFGEMVPDQQTVTKMDKDFVQNRNPKDVLVENVPQLAHANFVRAVIGAVYLHCGREAVKSFVKSHCLSRQLDIANLFSFKLPTRDLAKLCEREDFEAPVARLESETGRMSRTPVFVVGIYSGRDKLGEGSGPNLDHARIAAAINALKSWYLYSPGTVGVPSDTFAQDAEPWKPAHVDIGEIISA